jgi:hypothetical protein
VLQSPWQSSSGGNGERKGLSRWETRAARPGDATTTAAVAGGEEGAMDGPARLLSFMFILLLIAELKWKGASSLHLSTRGVVDRR